MNLYAPNNQIISSHSPFNSTNASIIYGDLSSRQDITGTPAYIFGQEVVRPIFDQLGCLYTSIKSFVSNIHLPDLRIGSIVQAHLIPDAFCDGDPHYLMPLHTTEESLESCVSVTPSNENQYFNIPFYGNITQNQLLERFENLGMLGGGGDAVVYKVADRFTGKKYAMSVEYTPRLYISDRRRSFFEQMFVMQKKNPNVAQIFAVFWLEFKNVLRTEPDYASVHDNYENDIFINNKHEKNPSAKTYYKEVIIKELGETDLTRSQFHQLNLSPLDRDIQIWYNYYQLALHKIAVTDMKPRNYVWIRTADMEFNGRSLKNIEYFCYNYKNALLYVQTPIVIKSVDYSGWSKYATTPEEEWLNRILTDHKLTIEDLLNLYPKPNVSEDKILYLE